MDYAVQSFNCGANTEGVGCASNQFPASGTSVTYHDVFRSLGPDLLLTGVTSPGLIPQGGAEQHCPEFLEWRRHLQKQHRRGGAPILLLGRRANARGLSLQPPDHLGGHPGLRHPIMSFEVTLPSTIAQGPGYLIAEFLPGPEAIDQLPSYASAAVVVGPPVPDLAAQGNLGFAPAAVVTGEKTQFTFSVANVGQVDAAASNYAIYVSLVGAISQGDIQIGSGTLPAIPVGQTFSPPTQTFPIPLTLVSGDYLIGVIVDPTNTLGEADMSNNIAVGKTRLSVTSLGPVIATSSLPDDAGDCALLDAAHRRRRGWQIHLVSDRRGASERAGLELAGDPQRAGGAGRHRQLHGQGHRRGRAQRHAVADHRSQRVRAGADHRDDRSAGWVDGAALRFHACGGGRDAALSVGAGPGNGRSAGGRQPGLGRHLDRSAGVRSVNELPRQPDRRPGHGRLLPDLLPDDFLGRHARGRIHAVTGSHRR